MKNNEELKEFFEMAEEWYHRDQFIRRDCKICIGYTMSYKNQTDEDLGELHYFVTGTMENAIKYAEEFIKKHNSGCYIFDFENFPDVKWKKRERITINALNN